MLFHPVPSRPRSRPVLIGSVLLHVALLAALLHVVRPRLAPMRLPGDERGSHVALTFTPGRAVAHTGLTTPAAKPVPSTTARPTPALQATAAPAPGTAASNPNASSGGDALGSGNVTVALATFFPRPQPDLSTLPAGTQGDVILEVVIDAQGRIADARVSQSLGQAVDATVLATIQTWQFKPATKDGVPVPSEQELLFHYARG